MSYINQYIDSQDYDTKEALLRICRIVKARVPEAEEGMSYGMPAFKYKNRPLIGFSVAKNHMSLYPFDPRVIAEVKTRLSGFEVSKGLVRFNTKHQVPEDVIKAMISLRLDLLSKA